MIDTPKDILTQCSLATDKVCSYLRELNLIVEDDSAHHLLTSIYVEILCLSMNIEDLKTRLKGVEDEGKN